MLQTVLVIRKTLSLPFQFLTVLFAGSSWLHRDGKWEHRGMRRGHHVALPSLCCLPPQASPQTWLLGFSQRWKKFVSCFFRGSYKKNSNSHKILVSNRQLLHAKKWQSWFHSFLYSMCYPPAKAAVHVAAACCKNRFENIYFYHLRTNLCSLLLKSNTTTPNLLRRSIAILRGRRKRHLKSSCQVLSLSYMKKGRVQNKSLCKSMPGTAGLESKGGTRGRFFSCL